VLPIAASLQRSATVRYTSRPDDLSLDDLGCAICLGTLSSAVAIEPCGHSFCATCLSHHFGSQLKASADISCPFRCDPGPATVVANRPARELVQVLAAKDGQLARQSSDDLPADSTDTSGSSSGSSSGGSSSPTGGNARQQQVSSSSSSSNSSSSSSGGAGSARNGSSCAPSSAAGSSTSALPGSRAPSEGGGRGTVQQQEGWQQEAQQQQQQQQQKQRQKQRQHDHQEGPHSDSAEAEAEATAAAEAKDPFVVPAAEPCAQRSSDSASSNLASPPPSGCCGSCCCGGVNCRCGSKRKSGEQQGGMSPLCPLHDQLLPVDLAQLVRPCGALDMRVSGWLWCGVPGVGCGMWHVACGLWAVACGLHARCVAGAAGHAGEGLRACSTQPAITTLVSPVPQQPASRAPHTVIMAAVFPRHLERPCCLVIAA
jgi:hypothetical protein